MFKILLADDELIIRKGIQTIIERNIKMDTQVILASNGIEALELVAIERPQLIITDINMPGLNGLEFIRKLKEKDQFTPILVISGYESFDYAKQAIELGVKEYITKPIDKETFVGTVHKYITQLMEIQQQLRKDYQNKKKSKEIIEGMKLEYLKQLLQCNNEREASIYLEQLRKMNLLTKPSNHVCVIYQYTFNSALDDMNDFAVANILDEYFQNRKEFILNIRVQSGLIVTMLRCGAEGLNTLEYKAKLRQASLLIQNLLQNKVYIGVGSVVAHFDKSYLSYQQAQEAIQYKIFEQGENCIYYEGLERGITIPQEKALSFTDTIAVRNEITRITSFGINQDTMATLIHLYQKIMTYVVSRQTATQSQDMKQFYEFWSIDELKKYVKDKLELVNRQGDDRTSNVHLMKQILSYIDSHYTEDIGLDVISHRFGRSPGYISTMFKRYADEGLNHYVTKKRMELATQLLTDSSRTIQEIADQCGYYNAKYFSMVFKKYLGQTPSEYRDRL